MIHSALITVAFLRKGHIMLLCINISESFSTLNSAMIQLTASVLAQLKLAVKSRTTDWGQHLISKDPIKDVYRAQNSTMWRYPSYIWLNFLQNQKQVQPPP